MILFCPGKKIFANPPIISGSVYRPIPALLPLDYSASLCAAWLIALKHSEVFLPGTALEQLRQTGLDMKKATQSLCALLFPVDVVTPEFSSGAEIRVFLASPPNLSEKLQNILKKPMELIFMAAFIEELQYLMRQLKEAWPKDLKPDSADLERLERISAKIGCLWTAINPVPGNLCEGFNEFMRVSPAMAAFQARRELQEGNWQEAVSLASRAKNNIAKLVEKKDPSLLTLLNAIILNIRGQAHLGAGQTALAEFDFTEALKLLEDAFSFPDLKKELLFGRAMIRHEKRAWQEMCADLEQICQLGDCHSLFEARLRRLCPGMENESTDSD